MKKRIMLISAVFIMTAMLLGGCGKPAEVQPEKESEAPKTEEQDATKPIPLTYSFLYDEDTRNEVREIMEAGGVDQESIESFMTIVTQFADTLGNMKGAEDGFITIEDASEPFYDSEYIGITFDKSLSFDDQNCRLTAYSLFHNLYTVSAGSPFVYEDDSLYGDLEILKLNKNLSFSEDDIRKYTTLFSEVKTEESASTGTHAGNVKAAWEERGITFDAQSGAQLITVMLNDPERDTIFAGHAGLLFETADGYLLIEKLSQYTPFVAAKFDDLEALNTYLISEVSLFPQDGAAAPFVMRNNELLVQ